MVRRTAATRHFIGSTPIPLSRLVGIKERKVKHGKDEDDEGEEWNVSGEEVFGGTGFVPGSAEKPKT